MLAILAAGVPTFHFRVPVSDLASPVKHTSSELSTSAALFYFISMSYSPSSAEADAVPADTMQQTQAPAATVSPHPRPSVSGRFVVKQYAPASSK